MNPDRRCPPSTARFQAMAQMLVRADREDSEWSFELMHAIRRLDRRDRVRLQELLNRFQDDGPAPMAWIERDTCRGGHGTKDDR